MEILLIIVGVLALFITMQLISRNTTGPDQNRSEPDFDIAKYLSEKQEENRKLEKIDY